MKKTEIAAIIFGVVIIAIVLFVLVTRPPQKTAPAATIQNLPSYSTPERFPLNVPLEVGATIAQNYNATAADGRVQATRSFESKKTIDDNFALYKNFIADPKNGWTYLNEVNDPTHKALFASGAGGVLNINISSVGSGTSFVDISFTSKK